MRAVDSFDGTGVADDDSLAEAGMDSMDRACLFLAIEGELGVKVSDDAFQELDTLAAIAGHVSKHRGESA